MLKTDYKANSKDDDGYVSKGNGQANKVWKTDGSGNPGWLDDSDNDTKNTAGATNNTTGPLYLIGAASQEANPQTYSNSSVSMTNGALTAISYNINSKATWQYNEATDCIELTW